MTWSSAWTTITYRSNPSSPTITYVNVTVTLKISLLTLFMWQKLSCSFTLDVPGLGYLEGGTEPNVRTVFQRVCEGLRVDTRM